MRATDYPTLIMAWSVAGVMLAIAIGSLFAVAGICYSFIRPLFKAPEA